VTLRAFAFLWLALAGSGCENESSTELRVVGGDPQAGRRIILDVGCGACHHIPGIAGALGIVGPSLNQFGRHALIAGVIPNRPTELVLWVREAPALVPDTAMPSMPITESQARDVAAFLYTLR
jgi:mono/diheme cytochrome c family protein